MSEPAAERRWPPIVTALGIQVLAICLAAGVVLGVSPHAGFWATAALAGIVAGALTACTSLDRWWIPMQGLFPMLFAAALVFAVPAWVYFLGFMVVALVYSTTVRTRVPLYLSGAETWAAVAALLPEASSRQRLHVVDLGSGLGGFILDLGARRPDAEVVGVELAPLPALWSRLRVALSGRGNVRVRWGSFWNEDLREYDLVFAFLSPVPMARLWDKAQREMHPGSTFVSCAFAVPGVEPQQVIELGGARQTRLFVWRMRGREP